MSEETNEKLADDKKVREKKNSIPTEKVTELIAGLPQYDKASFTVVGHKGGTRVALPKTNGVSRAYFYGSGTVPSHEAIIAFTEEERRERRLGGVTARVDFSKGVDPATQALELLLEEVRNAPAPAPKALKAPKSPKEPKKPKPTPADETQAGN